MSFDYDIADPGAQDMPEISFPMVIWRNGDPAMKKLGAGCALDGGFFFPIESAGEATEIDGWTRDSFIGDRDQAVEGLYAKAADIAIIRLRRRWQGVDDRGNKIFLPWNQYDRNLKLKGRLHAVGFVRGFDEPVIFSFSGVCMKEFEAAYNEFYKKVIMGVVNKTAPAGKTLPAYACYMRIIAGQARRAKPNDQQSKFITPPRFHAPATIDRAYAESKYIGRDRLQVAQNMFYDLAEWAREWDRFDEVVSSAPAIEDIVEGEHEPSTTTRRPPPMTRPRDIDELEMPSADEIFGANEPPPGY